LTCVNTENGEKRRSSRESGTIGCRKDAEIGIDIEGVFEYDACFIPMFKKGIEPDRIPERRSKEAQKRMEKGFGIVREFRLYINK
jgi:hypothetical protein